MLLLLLQCGMVCVTLHVQLQCCYKCTVFCSCFLSGLVTLFLVATVLLSTPCANVGGGCWLLYRPLVRTCAEQCVLKKNGLGFMHSDLS